MRMAWGEWMCPVLGPEHMLTLERERRAIDGYDLPQAKAMLRSMSQLMLQQELMLRGATKRIAELECQEALQEKAPHRQGGARFRHPSQ